MPTKRRVLETLTLKELQDLAEAYELAVGDRRVRDQLVDAASHSREVALADILPQLSRDRLKEMCRALGLDDHGKEKAAIVARIIGSAPAQGTLALGGGATPKNPKEPQEPQEPQGKAPEPPRTRAGVKPADAKNGNGASGGDLSFEAKLWLAADKLRNNMDAAEYKHVVLGLIFLKYISDAFEELHARLVAGEGDCAGADPEDPDEYKAESVFWVPRDARWSKNLEGLGYGG